MALISSNTKCVKLLFFFLEKIVFFVSFLFYRNFETCQFKWEVMTGSQPTVTYKYGFVKGKV